MAKHAATRLQGGRHRAEGRNPVISQPLSIAGGAGFGLHRAVGALALALGVGAAVSTGFGMGIAHAQNGGGTDTQSADAPADPKAPAPDQQTGEPAPSAGSDGSTGPDSGADNASDNAMDFNSSGGLDDSTNDHGQSSDGDNGLDGQQDGDDAEDGGGLEVSADPPGQPTEPSAMSIPHPKSHQHIAIQKRTLCWASDCAALFRLPGLPMRAITPV